MPGPTDDRSVLPILEGIWHITRKGLVRCVVCIRYYSYSYLHFSSAPDPDIHEDISPAFLLFLHCVLDLQYTFPEAFEFTESLLFCLMDVIFLPINRSFFYSDLCRSFQRFQVTRILGQKVFDSGTFFPEARNSRYQPTPDFLRGGSNGRGLWFEYLLRYFSSCIVPTSQFVSDCRDGRIKTRRLYARLSYSAFINLP